MSTESGSGFLVEEQAQIEIAERDIGAGLAVSAFSSEEEEEYEKNVSNLHQFYLHYFEREKLSEQKTSADSENAQLLVQEITERMATLQKCQRPLFDHDAQLKEMLDHAVKVVHKSFNAQISAIFLIDKTGELKRYSLHGITSYKQPIDANWFKEEKYAINTKSLVGKTVLSSHSSAGPGNAQRFGKLHYTHIEEEFTNGDNNASIYIDECGPFHQLIALPINNRSRTFGVLRIINKIDPRTQKVLKNKFFTERDLFYLSLFASEIGCALLNFERDSNRRLFSSLLKKITRPELVQPDAPDQVENKEGHPADLQKDQSESIKKFLDNTLISMVKNEISPFNFAIIRLLCDDPADTKIKGLAYRIASKAAFVPELNISRDNKPIPEDNHHTFVSLAASQRKHFVISDISPRLSRFHNMEWIERHKFSTFCCFPLVCREECFGTLSLYTTYRYTYDAKSIELIQTISDTIATFLYIERMQSKSREDVENILTLVCGLFKKELALD